MVRFARTLFVAAAIALGAGPLAASLAVRAAPE
jgi:hypothetical protein